MWLGITMNAYDDDEGDEICLKLTFSAGLLLPGRFQDFDQVGQEGNKELHKLGGEVIHGRLLSKNT